MRAPTRPPDEPRRRERDEDRNAVLVSDDSEIGLFNEKLKDWEDFYNFHRPHGGLDGQTPSERLRQKTKTRPRNAPTVSRTPGVTWVSSHEHSGVRTAVAAHPAQQVAGHDSGDR
ncbi:MAG: hypothetical protein QOK43_2233 [Acidimicrobiaceae bacterium]|nr:hypothetical protein [Acidimicrobiaceae bacterium]